MEGDNSKFSREIPNLEPVTETELTDFELLSLITSHFVPREEFTLTGLAKILNTAGLKVGEFRHEQFSVTKKEREKLLQLLNSLIDLGKIRAVERRREVTKGKTTKYFYNRADLMK